MPKHPHASGIAPEERAARDWVAILARYRDPNTMRSLFELAVTLVPFFLLWALAWWALDVSYWLAAAIATVNAAFLVRIFAIQHDCGHGSFLSNRKASDWLGRFLGILTLTPYDVWRRAHAIHHSSAGNLGRRGMGDITTLTVSEYRALPPGERLKYRIYRSPLVMFGLGPTYTFFLENRLPIGFMNNGIFWFWTMATNTLLFGGLALIFYFGGWPPILLIFLPSSIIAATLGIWLFYVQHQFEATHWDQEENWQLHDAALFGSSYYVLPPLLQWTVANIGIHHIHHLNSRIPFYRLPEVLRDHAYLANNNRMTIRESLASVRLHLWDEHSRRLLSFSEARALPA